MASIISKRDTDYKAGTGVKVGLKAGTTLGKKLAEFGYKDGDQFDLIIAGSCLENNGGI